MSSKPQAIEERNEQDANSIYSKSGILKLAKEIYWACRCTSQRRETERTLAYNRSVTLHSSTTLWSSEIMIPSFHIWATHKAANFLEIKDIAGFPNFVRSCKTLGCKLVAFSANWMTQRRMCTGWTIVGFSLRYQPVVPFQSEHNPTIAMPRGWNHTGWI